MITLTVAEEDEIVRVLGNSGRSTEDIFYILKDIKELLSGKGTRTQYGYKGPDEITDISARNNLIWDTLQPYVARRSFV